MKRAAEIWAGVRRRDGQALVIVALSMVVMIAFTGLVIDVGRVYVAQRKLQGAVDAAALAAGQDLPNATKSYSDAVSYGATGAGNPVGGYGVSAVAPSVTFECLSHAPNYTAGSPQPARPTRVARAATRPAPSRHSRPESRPAMRSMSRRRRR